MEDKEIINDILEDADMIEIDNIGIGENETMEIIAEMEE